MRVGGERNSAAGLFERQRHRLGGDRHGLFRGRVEDVDRGRLLLRVDRDFDVKLMVAPFGQLAAVRAVLGMLVRFLLGGLPRSVRFSAAGTSARPADHCQRHDQEALRFDTGEANPSF